MNFSNAYWEYWKKYLSLFFFYWKQEEDFCFLSMVRSVYLLFWALPHPRDSIPVVHVASMCCQLAPSGSWFQFSQLSQHSLCFHPIFLENHQALLFPIALLHNNARLIDEWFDKGWLINIWERVKNIIRKLNLYRFSSVFETSRFNK